MARIYLFLLFLAVVSGKVLDVDVRGGGLYSVTIDGKAWLNASETFFRSGGAKLTTADGSLKLVSTSERTAGSDVGGTFERIEQQWQGGFATAFRIYTSHIVFEQNWPASNGTAAPTSEGGKDGVAGGFPSFKVEALAGTPRGVLSFQGDMTGSNAKTGTWAAGSMATTPRRDVAEGGDPMAKCRIVTAKNFQLTPSGAGALLFFLLHII